MDNKILSLFYCKKWMGIKKLEQIIQESKDIKEKIDDTEEILKHQVLLLSFIKTLHN